MFQPKMLFEAYAYHSRVGERDSRPKGIMYLNSTLFPEGEGVTATCLGQCPSRGIIIIASSRKIIHRAPSVEEVTATCLGSLFVSDECKEINRKSAPNELFLVSNYKNERR
jgi:hypothetical protein